MFWLARADSSSGRRVASTSATTPRASGATTKSKRKGTPRKNTRARLPVGCRWLIAIHGDQLAGVHVEDEAADDEVVGEQRARPR